MPERPGNAAPAWLPIPTRPALSLLALAVGVELFGRLLGSRGLSVVAAGLIGSVIAAALLTPRVSGVAVKLLVPARTAVGAESSVRLAVVAPTRRRWRSGPFLLTVASPAYGDATVMTPAIPAGGRVVTTYTVRPTHRGYWGGTQVTVEAVSPLGGFVRRRTLTCDNRMWVHPAPALPFSLPPTNGSQATRAGIRSRPSATGTEVAGLREWQAGDPAGRVHWRASARRNQLVVMERDDNLRLATLIATGRHGSGDAWERAVARCAATALASLRSGHAVVLVSAADVRPVRSAREVLDHFAELSDSAPNEAETTARVVPSLRRAGAGTVLLWLSADPPPGEVMAAARGASTFLVRAFVPDPGLQP